MQPLTWTSLAILGVTLVACGCGGPAETSGPENANVPQSTPVARSTAPPPPLTDEECGVFVERMLASIQPGATDEESDLFDIDAFVDRCVDRTRFTDKTFAFIRNGLQELLNGRNRFVAQRRQLIEQGGSYAFLHIHETEGRKRALFRMLGPAGGVTYHDILLTKGTDGVVRGADLYLHLAGEFFSDMSKRMLTPMMKSDPQLASGLSDRDRMLLSHLKELSNLSGIAAAERPHEALRAFGGLPAELRKEKWILILRLNAAIKSDDEDEYISALSDFRKVFPSETWIEFLSVDYYLEKKEFDQALAAIDSQAAAIGGDPYLDVMRANALLSADRTEDALKAVRTAMNADPTLQDAHWTLLEIRLQQKDFREALNCMKDIDSRFVCDWAGMEQNLQYAEFIKSPQYAEWLAHRANKRKTSK